MSQQSPPQFKTFAPAKQQQLDELLERNAAGQLDAAAQAALEALVAEAEDLMVANSRLLADFARSQQPQSPIAAVPVTVWVTPQPADH